MKTYKEVTLLMSYRSLVFQEMQFGEPRTSWVLLLSQSTDGVLCAQCGVCLGLHSLVGAPTNSPSLNPDVWQRDQHGEARASSVHAIAARYSDLF